MTTFSELPQPKTTATTTSSGLRPIAYYLPQFYPTPENDAWWGKGFTEWTNVSKARPLFPGHYQPRLPADLGFYDLRVPETRQAQAELAQAHGVEGFCYWHYWFEGTRLLDRPFDEVLHSGEPDFPFCLAWANHTWSRRWTGSEDDVLRAQTYSREDDYNHIRWLAKAFADPRYIRVNGRPLFLVYDPYRLPEPQRTIEIFRCECVRLGLPEPFLLGLNQRAPSTDTRLLGFDGTVDHQPYFGALPGAFGDKDRKRRLVRNIKYKIINPNIKLYDYAEASRVCQDRQLDYPHFPCVFPGWDNSARIGSKAIVLTDATPDAFEKQLQEAAAKVRSLPSQERLIFINAWNEWGEGMYLEPDSKYRTGFLESIKRVCSQNINT